MMNKRTNYIWIVISLLTLLLVYVFQQKTQPTVLPETVKIALRDAGDQLLLSQNDSISLILPVKKLENHQFELAFNNSIYIQPNDLVFFVKRSLTKAKLPVNYRVEVNQCKDEEVAYSYVIKETEEDSIIPCSGRVLPKSCYVITITFLKPQTLLSTRNLVIIKYLLGCSILGCLFLLFIIRKKKPAVIEAVSELNIEAQKHQIGHFSFYPEQLKLIQETKEIKLSKKECELLSIFVAKPNQIITREELTKKVWEDNGVIVGRSLDTYISKLRKILKADDSLKLTNVHGVGYKLETK